MDVSYADHNDDKCWSAPEMIRKFEIIGEAGEHLSEETTRRLPDLPWQRIAGMRDRQTHDYLGVDRQRTEQATRCR